MTEQDWLTATDPTALLAFVQQHASARKLRLFACACAERAALVAPSTDCSALLAVVYRYADGLATERDLAAAEKKFQSRYAGPWEAPWVYAAHPNPAEAAALAAEIAATVAVEAAYAAVLDAKGGEGDGQLAADAADVTAQRAQADLLRHLFGNPFRPPPRTTCWSALVLDLARQLYEGRDVRPILHDALLDAGHAELAAHFRTEETHPKGCWALDQVLGMQ